MFSSKWREAFRDLSTNKMRTLLVTLAIAIGVFGLSVVANSYSILSREMDKNYMSTNPSSAVLCTDYIDASRMERIKSLPYIDEAERREKIAGRVQVGENEWKDIWLYVIDDFNHLHLDTFSPERGKISPGKGELLLERKALRFANATIGQDMPIKIPGGNVAELKLTGSVHAPGLAPAWMEGCAYGFITQDTYKLLGRYEKGTELKVKVTGDTMDKEHIRKVAYQLKDYLNQNGIGVTHIEIPEPGKHPHAAQMAGLLFLMEAFGILALLLSGVLVSNMITSILNQQTRQIGIMKAVGADSLQISGIYLGMILMLSFIAMLLAIPAGIFAGQAYAYLAADILNFKINSNTIPVYIFLIELALGLLIPLLASAVPISRACNITVREAILNYGIKGEHYNGRENDKITKASALLSRPFLLSLRNTFRRKGRLIFTLLIMAVGGTGFIVAINIYSSMYHTVDAKMDTFSYDIQISFEQPLSSEQIADALKSIPAIDKAEYWGGVSADIVYKDKTTGNNFRIVAPPSDTKLMKAPPLYHGRWLKPGDTNAIVVNQLILAMEPEINIGDTIMLRINQKDTAWKVIGVSRELLGQPTAYVNQDYLAKLTGQTGYFENAVIVIKDRTKASQSAAAKLLEQTMLQNNTPLCSLTKLSDYRTSLINHLKLAASFLIIMSVLVVLVGGLGLATTLSINTMERTREIGIMRAIGAPTWYISGIIVAEGIIIGVISWLIACIWSWPLSILISNRFGMVFFKVPLAFAASAYGYVIWLAVVILFAAAASFYPSYKASKMQIKNALSYE